MSEIESEIKPCPFCGGKAKLESLFNNFSYVMCEACGARTHMSLVSCHYCSDDMAIAMWNRRVSDDN